MGKIIPTALILTGVIAGGAAGHFLQPPPDVGEETCADQDETCEPGFATAAASDSHGRGTHDTDFANLNKQFVVPIIKDDKVVALVVASLSLEVESGAAETVYDKEPKLRDVFLKVLFTHAHSGGFSGEFTSGHAIEDLRGRLFEVAHEVVGGVLQDVLIVEIVRQDM